MNDGRYRFILILISVVVFITLTIQLHGVFKNYEESERQLQRDIKTSFDLTVEDYFTSTDKSNTLSFFKNKADRWPKGKIDSLIKTMGTTNRFLSSKDSSQEGEYKSSPTETFITSKPPNFPAKKEPAKIKSVSIFKNNQADSSSPENKAIKKLDRLGKLFFKDSAIKDTNVSLRNLKFTEDQISGSLQDTSDKIVISFSTNEMDLEVMESLMHQALASNDISINYGFTYNDGEDDFEYGNLDGEQSVESNSPQLYKNTELKMVYSGQRSTLLKRNLAGLSLSFILISGVIFCLFYLLHIIRKQKQLSLIKNDLISNITHEFKTPIATASAALEGVQNFTETGDHEKSNRYLNISREQLVKLNLMVEKLLETATIDNENLVLQRGKFSMNALIAASVRRYSSQTDKNLTFTDSDKSIEFYGDEFHLDNAINNLLDNAIKYGGNHINVSLSKSAGDILIKVEDNGNHLSPKDARLIFDKFYRVPDGDRHNIKGHGIGLYYSKAIIEKHQGTISLSLKPTTFTIQLPYD